MSRRTKIAKDNKDTNVLERLCTKEDVIIPPNGKQVVLMASRLDVNTTVTDILQPTNALTDDVDLDFCAGLVTLTNGQVAVHRNNFTDSSYTLNRGSQVANFTVQTPEQMKYGKTIYLVTTWHLLQTIHASSLMKSSRSDDFKEKLLVSHTRGQRRPSATYADAKRISKELQNLQEPENNNLQDDHESR